MDITLALRKKAKAAGVPWQYIVMADLINIGYSEIDAYIIAYSENRALNDQRNMAIRNSIQKTETFDELLRARKNTITTYITASCDENEKLELIGTEETAREILTVAMGMPESSKERGEMFMKYADLIRKNDTATKEEDPVRIYLPAKCDQCPVKKMIEDMDTDDSTD